MDFGGVSFQPGTSDFEQRREESRRRVGGADGVQEAIKVLSLRLPKVVGAQAVAPQALLTAPGSDGDKHVDSMIERVLQRVFPTRPTPGVSAPMVPVGNSGSSPSFGSSPAEPPTVSVPQFAQSGDDRAPARPTIPHAPRVIAGPPPMAAPFTAGPIPKYPNLPGVDGGGGFPNAAIEPFPGEIPNLRRDYLDWLPDVGGIEPAPLI